MIAFRSQFEQEAVLADVHPASFADGDVHPGGLVDVAAEQVLRLALLNEIADGAAAEMGVGPRSVRGVWSGGA